MLSPSQEENPVKDCKDKLLMIKVSFQSLSKTLLLSKLSFLVLFPNFLFFDRKNVPYLHAILLDVLKNGTQFSIWLEGFHTLLHRCVAIGKFGVVMLRDGLWLPGGREKSWLAGRWMLKKFQELFGRLFAWQAPCSFPTHLPKIPKAFVWDLSHQPTRHELAHASC